MSGSDDSSASSKRSWTSPTGSTPKGKKSRTGQLSDVLKDLYVSDRNANSTIPRSEVMQKVRGELSEDDQWTRRPLTERLLGLAMTTAFGKDAVTLHGHNRDIFQGLSERSFLETEPLRSVALTAEELGWVTAIREERWDDIFSRDAATRLVEKTIIHEVEAYSKIKDSIMRKTDAHSLLVFRLHHLREEFKDELPTLYRLVDAASTRKDFGQRKTKASIQPAIVTVIAKILAIYSNSLSVWRYIEGLMLITGGTKESTINRFANLYDSVKAVTLRNKLDALASHGLSPLHTWREHGQHFTMVFDNVNKHVKARHQSMERGNTMHNLTHAIALLNRIDFSDQSRRPLIPIRDIEPTHLLPSPTTMATIRDKFVSIVLDIWSTYIEELSWMRPEVIPHQYAAQAKEMTEKVNLGVLKKDECKREEMLEILQEYNQLVPVVDGKIQHTAVVGDYLSYANGKSAQETQADNLSPTDRLEGLVLCLADFHAEMNLLDLIFHVLFQPDSSRSVGTVLSTKNILNTKNITKNASKNYYHHAELFDKLFTAYIILGALKVMKMTSVDSSCDVTEKTSTAAKELAGQFVDEFVSLTVPDAQHRGTTTRRCSHCGTSYKTVVKLVEHHKSEHPDEAALNSAVEDPVYAHTQSLVTLGLLRQLLRRSIKCGNGEDVMLVYQFQFIISKTHGHKNYACGLLETLVQTHVLPQYLSQSIIWNRFANNKGRWDSNLSLDLHLEHENRNLKSELKPYRGTFTQSGLDRVSLGRNPRESIIGHLDEEIGVHNSRRPAYELSRPDIMILVEKMKDAGLLNQQQGRRGHSHLLSFVTGNPMDDLGGSQLRQWMTDRLAESKTKNYYKQFE